MLLWVSSRLFEVSLTEIHRIEGTSIQHARTVLAVAERSTAVAGLNASAPLSDAVVGR